MFLMMRNGVPYLTYVSYAAYVLMSRGKRRKIVIVSSLKMSDEPKKSPCFALLMPVCYKSAERNSLLEDNTNDS